MNFFGYILCSYTKVTRRKISWSGRLTWAQFHGLWHQMGWKWYQFPPVSIGNSLPLLRVAPSSSSPSTIASIFTLHRKLYLYFSEKLENMVKIWGEHGKWTRQSLSFLCPIYKIMSSFKISFHSYPPTPWRKSSPTMGWW